MTTTSVDRCSFPSSVENHNVIPCNRPAVSVYIVAGERLPRCRRHDGPSVRALADEKGYLRTELAA